MNALSVRLRDTPDARAAAATSTVLVPFLDSAGGRFVSLADIERRCQIETARLITLHVELSQLAQQGCVEFASGCGDPDLVLTPISRGFVLDLRQPPSGNHTLSRFALLRKLGDELILECPLGYARLAVRGGDALNWIAELACRGVNATEETDSGRLLLLRMAGALECRGESEAPSVSLRQWEFHDLLFHSRSRIGRHDYEIGGTFRFKDVLPPQPALKKRKWTGLRVSLARADLAALAAADMPTSLAVEMRRSERQQGEVPLSIDDLGAFLYRVARVRSVAETPIGEFTNRPYPSGGASYELELYLTVDRCLGLRSGFYYYDPAGHALELIAEPNLDTEELILDAYRSSAQTCRPQILITVASRFQRVSWKYAGIAYAAQLKNVGALYSVMYIIATAMRLAPCALGLGNSELFCRLSRTDPFEETSIGEFMLGSLPTPIG